MPVFKEEYISLREAAKISGYSSDYVGQLIRSGKLPGKQVFSHVAWMTTEAALKEYMQKKRVGKAERTWKESSITFFKSFSEKAKRQMEIPKLFTSMLYMVMGVAACFLLLLFYIFSASLEHKLDQRAIEQAQTLHAL